MVTMQAHEDLAALFSRNLTLDPPPPPPPKEEPKIVYISQHYTHSAHLLQQQQQQQQQQPSPRPTSEPPQSEHAATETVLREHGVDTSCLSTAQLQLFRTVEGRFQLRLIEIWRASPPTSQRDSPTLACGFTTVDREETLARMRHERQRETIMSLDGTPLTPIQAADGRWLPAQAAPDVEPYMFSGYEDMARREYEESARRAHAEAVAGHTKDMVAYQPPQAAFAGCHFSRATDPVYRAGGDAIDWARQAQMEDQYGRMVQCRDTEMM